MKHKNKVLLSLLLLFLVPSSVQAYCPPYFAKIDSIENNKDCLAIRATSGCGGEVEIINHCSGEFYFYDEQSNLNENLVLINSEEWNRNLQKYSELGKKTGKDYWGHQYRGEPNFHFSCLEGKSKIVEGVNFCDSSEIEKADSGIVVKDWTIKMFSKDDHRDITIKGRTIYEKPLDIIDKGLFFISIFLFFVTFVLFFAKFVLKKRIDIAFIIVSVLISLSFYFFYFLSRFFIG